MPQVTNLVSKLLPRIEAETLLDIGCGDGETILSMMHLWKQPFLFACDPEESPKTMTNYEFEKKPYHESSFYNRAVDISTCFDSLACYYKSDGEDILQHIVENTKKMVVIWTPDGYYPYPPFKSCWHAEDFLSRGFCVYRAKDIHQGPPTVASGLLAWKVI
jgi:hypothetical protein